MGTHCSCWTAGAQVTSTREWARRPTRSSGASPRVGRGWGAHGMGCSSPTRTTAFHTLALGTGSAGSRRRELVSAFNAASQLRMRGPGPGLKLNGSAAHGKRLFRGAAEHRGVGPNMFP